MSGAEINETVIDENDLENDLENDSEDNTKKKFDPYEIYETDDRGRVVVPLKHPVKGKNKTFEEVALRVPKGGDLRIAGNAKNDTDNGLILLERCGEGLTANVVNNMRASDIKTLSQVLGFLAEE